MNTTPIAQTPAREGEHARVTPLRRLAQDSAVYGGADFVSKAIAFVTFPMIAAGLSPLAFGALELLVTAVGLLGLAANCGLNNAVQRFYWDPETAPHQRPALVSSGLAALVLLLLLSFALGLVATGACARWLSESNLPMTWIAPTAALVLMVVNQTSQYLLDVVRLHMKPWRFFGVSLAVRVATAFAGVAAVVWLAMGLDGLLVFQACVGLFALPLAALAVRQDLTARIDVDISRKLVRFGHPFIYSYIAFWLFGTIDRWLLAALSSVAELGIYSVAHRFASIVLMASFAFGQAWAPLALKARADDPKKYRGLYADVLIALACAMLALGASIAVFSGEVLAFLMPVEYHAAARPLAILCLGVVLQSTTQVTAIGISLENKTSLFARLSWITAGINLVLNLLLIPGLGATGAAFATALSYLFLTASYMYWSQALHPLPIRWRRVAVWLVMLVAIGMVVSGLTPATGHAQDIGVKSVLLIACIGTCFFLAAWRRSARVLA